MCGGPSIHPNVHVGHQDFQARRDAGEYEARRDVRGGSRLFLFPDPLGDAVHPDLGGAACPASVGIAGAACRLMTGVCAVDEFPYALPFRQYLEHGWTVSFAFPFLG